MRHIGFYNHEGRCMANKIWEYYYLLAKDNPHHNILLILDDIEDNTPHANLTIRNSKSLDRTVELKWDYSFDYILEEISYDSSKYYDTLFYYLTVDIQQIGYTWNNILTKIVILPSSYYFIPFHSQNEHDTILLCSLYNKLLGVSCVVSHVRDYYQFPPFDNHNDMFIYKYYVFENRHYEISFNTELVDKELLGKILAIFNTLKYIYKLTYNIRTYTFNLSDIRLSTNQSLHTYWDTSKPLTTEIFIQNLYENIQAYHLPF